MSEEGGARLRQVHASRRANEKERPELVFQTPDLTAHRGLRDAQLAGSPADVAFLGDRHEILDLGETHDSSLPAAAGSCPDEIQRVLDRGAGPTPWSRA